MWTLEKSSVQSNQCTIENASNMNYANDLPRHNPLPSLRKYYQQCSRLPLSQGRQMVSPETLRLRMLKYVFVSLWFIVSSYMYFNILNKRVVRTQRRSLGGGATISK